MKKETIISSILAIILPIALLAILHLTDKDVDKYEFLVPTLIIDLCIYFIMYIMLKYDKPLIGFLYAFNALGIIYNTIFIDKFYIAIIGLLLSNLCGYFAYKSKWLYFIEVIAIYPIIFPLYGFNMYTVIIGVALVCFSLLFSFYLRFRKTKIYLYDNY